VAAQSRRDRLPTADLLLALNAVPDVPRAALCRLALDLPLWHPAPALPLRELVTALGVPRRDLEKVYRALDGAAATVAGERSGAAAAGATVVTLADGEYPAALRELPLPPPVLYVRGALAATPAVAIVGSRRPTDYGREAAWLFARDLARAGVAVVSGFARGIDTAAHRGALDGGGTTIAVLGCGLAVPYPADNHRRLSAPIAERGALVAELPLHAPPGKLTFPVRNRIIAAFGAATLVVEAAARSGSLITARCALELGREVLALPGRIFDETAMGCNALIADGARPALHPRDVLAELGLLPPPEGPALPPPLPGLAAKLWQELPPGARRGADDLAGRCGEPADAVLAALLELELGGWVARLPGPVYARRG
jgi:DNA processing protein